MELFIVGILLGFVVTFTTFTLARRHKGCLILIEGDENETYAFLELHEPIDSIKNKKSISLKIERKAHD